MGQREIDNMLLSMIQKHFPALPLSDEYTDWGKWLGFARAAYEAGRASPASAPVAAPDYRIAGLGFQWDAKNRQHIPQLLIEFTPVPANAPNDSKGWKDRDKLAAILSAAPTPPSTEDRKDAERLDYIQNHGATIQIVPMANRTFGFEVGGLHKSRKLSVREAIDAAMQEDKP